MQIRTSQFTRFSTTVIFESNGQMSLSSKNISLYLLRPPFSLQLKNIFDWSQSFIPQINLSRIRENEQIIIVRVFLDVRTSNISAKKGNNFLALRRVEES